MATNVTHDNPVIAQLRDIHVPPPPDWWPPAIGWWMVAVAGVVLAFGVAWIIRRQSVLLAQHTALNTLRKLERAHAADSDAATFMAGVSQLVRQCALTWFPERHPGGLTGEAWLEFLDETGQTRTFVATPAGHALTRAPYDNTTDIDAAQIAQVVREWMRIAGRPRPALKRKERT